MKNITHPTTLVFSNVVSYSTQQAAPIAINQEITRGGHAEEQVRLELNLRQAIMLRAALDDVIKEARGR